MSTNESTVLEVTPRTTLKRHAERGAHERATIDAILDEALVCHVAVAVDGMPRVLPTAHVRVGDAVYLHGARANRLLTTLATGAPASLCVTIVDGLVFARRAFSHSMNFRSAVLYGTFAEVVDEGEKRLALAALLDQMAPGRSGEARPPNAEELRSTLVVKLPILEGSAKVRTGPPRDLADEPESACWTGELPLRTRALPPRVDPSRATEPPTSPAVRARARSLEGEGGLAPYEVRRGALSVSTERALLDFRFVHRFLAEESYWARDVSPERQRRAMEHALCFGLYEDERQIGFARVVTDFGRIAYLGDVFVDRAARGRGLGTWLVDAVLAHPALAGVERWLLGTADAHGLYARFGFVRAPDGRYMVRAGT